MIFKRFFLIALLLNTLNVYSQNAPGICRILKDSTFTVLDHSANFTGGGGGLGDDGSYIGDPINLGFNFNFFGQNLTQVYLNINGNLTFDGNLGTYNTQSLSTFTRKMIAPFWADVDLLLPEEAGIPSGKIYFKKNPTNFIVIWEKVGYYFNKTDKVNTFQLVITNGNDPLLPAGRNVGFYYESMNWTSGEASATDNGFCGYPATVGITYGDGRNFFQIGRFDHDGLDYKGVYQGENVTPPGCNASNGTKLYDGVKWLEKRCNLVYDLSQNLLAIPGECKGSNVYDLHLTYFLINSPTSGNLQIYVDDVLFQTIDFATGLPASGPLLITIPGLTSDGAIHNVNAYSNSNEISVNATYSAPPSCTGSSCAECIPSFSPIPGQQYLLSAWVKEEYINNIPATYSNSGVKISFNQGAIMLPVMRPSGSIVDGWQRIEESFTVPAGAQNIQIKLFNETPAGSGYSVYFDDVRMHPFSSNMKSYVYDPSTQRLSAELDENNYATHYEYDDEGILIRVKKETERGVMTIKETRNNQSKIKP